MITDLIRSMAVRSCLLRPVEVIALEHATEDVIGQITAMYPTMTDHEQQLVAIAVDLTFHHNKCQQKVA